ncbi:hypothetical protein BLNAU_13042 [Blattamonas nauphoetae]|uniref:Uncharacterized protein n=1 Tax=Blattamonas nauphoetae TaxID=2049346 RepID=A0ABQ9XPK7_9EUKA|nr:hypothetical protein BLNAU_13042 [Blattamonas nauphoetae]
MNCRPLIQPFKSLLEPSSFTLVPFLQINAIHSINTNLSSAVSHLPYKSFLLNSHLVEHIVFRLKQNRRKLPVDQFSEGESTGRTSTPGSLNVILRLLRSSSLITTSHNASADASPVQRTPLQSSTRHSLFRSPSLLSLLAIYPSFPLSIGKHTIDIPQERVERKRNVEVYPKQLDAFEESLFVPFASDTLDTISDCTKLEHVRRIIRKRISDLPSSLELNPLFSEIERQVESELLVFLQNKIDRKKHKSKIEWMMASDQTNKLHRRLGGDDSTRPTSAAVPTHLPQQPRFQIRTGNIDNSPSLVKPSQSTKEQSQQSTPILQRGERQRLSEIEAEEENDTRDVLTMLDTAEKMLREYSPLTHPKVLGMTQNTLDQTSFFEFNLDFSGNVQADDTPAPTHALPE